MNTDTLAARAASIDISYPPIPQLLGISPHGLLAAVGIGAGLWLLVHRLRSRGLPVDPAYKAVTWGVAAAIVGARVDYVISHLQDFSSLGEMVALWRGGLALFGGLIAGTATAAIILFRNQAPVVASLDAAAPAFTLAIAVGRTGDLLLTDHLGRPIGDSFGIGYRIIAGSQLAPGFTPSPAVTPAGGQSCSDLGTYYAGCSYHLTAGYDLLGATLLTVLLLILSTRALRPGVLIATFGLLYGTQRLLLDFTRGIDERPLLGLTGTQLLSILLILAGAAVLVWLLARPRRGSSIDDFDGDVPSQGRHRAARASDPLDR